MFTPIAHSIRDVFSTGRSAALFVLLWALFFAFMYMIPVRLIPGNDIAFQATVYNAGDYLQLGVLSFLSALVLQLQMMVFRKNRAALGGGGLIGGAGILSGIFSSLFASASCALCIGGLFSFLSASALLFLVEHQTPIFLLGLGLLLLSLHFSSQRLHGVCESCRVG